MHQPSALPMISAMETKIAAMKIATATFPTLQLRGKVHLRRQPVDQAVRHVHQHHADDGVQHVDGDDGELHGLLE
jgi:hypothetical protein